MSPRFLVMEAWGYLLACSYPHAQRYDLGVDERTLINIIETLKAEGSISAVPGEIQLKDGRNDSSDYVDPDPNEDDKPFYYTDEEEAYKVGKDGYSTTFTDTPFRYTGSDHTTWIGELSIVGMKDGVWVPILTITYGFEIKGDTIILIPIMYTTPSQFHLNAIPNSK